MQPEFYKTKLDSGLTILFEKRNLPVVSVAFAARAGGINECIEEKGISHYIEHMLFKGTKLRNAKKIAEEIEKNGGVLNGFTDETITAYWCKMPSKHLSTALNVLSDIVKNPLFNEKEMEKERKVIFEEIKMRKDDPQIYVFDKIQSCLYRGTLAVPLSGTYETMDYIDRKKITAKFNQLYHPNNLILCVVGDASFDEIVKFAKQNFPAKKGTVPKIEIGLKNEEKIETRKGIEQANLVFAYHTPLATDKRHYAALALNTLMAVGLSSRLFAEIREKRNLAYSIRGDSSITKDYAYNAIYIGTMKQNVEIVKKLILEEFSKVAKELTEKELKQVKEQLIGRYKIFMEDSRLQMLNLLSYEIDGCVEDYYAFEKNISEIKLQDVKNLAGLKDYSFFALVPEQD